MLALTVQDYFTVHPCSQSFNPALAEVAAKTLSHAPHTHSVYCLVSEKSLHLMQLALEETFVFTVKEIKIMSDSACSLLPP